MPNVEGVLNLYFDVFKPSPQLDVDELREKIEKLLQDSDYKLFTTEIDGVVVCTMMGVIIRNLVGLGRDYMVIENIATHPNYQKRGFASALYGEAEKWAK